MFRPDMSELVIGPDHNVKWCKEEEKEGKETKYSSCFELLDVFLHRN